MGEEGGGGSDDFDPHGDPNTDPKERRRIRYEYRELIAETQKNRHDLIKPDSGGLHKALDKADNLFKSVRLTREAVLDSHFLVLASNLGSQQAQQLQTHLVTFDRDTFVQKLITFMGGRNINDLSREDDEDDGEVPTRRQRRPGRSLDRKLVWHSCEHLALTLCLVLCPWNRHQTDHDKLKRKVLKTNLMPAKKSHRVSLTKWSPRRRLLPKKLIEYIKYFLKTQFQGIK